MFGPTVTRKVSSWDSYTMFTSSITATCGLKLVRIGKSASQTQDNHTTVAWVLVIFFCFKFATKSTSLRHTPIQTIPLKLWQLKGRPHKLLLVNEALQLVVWAFAGNFFFKIMVNLQDGKKHFIVFWPECAAHLYMWLCYLTVSWDSGKGVGTS